MANTSILERNFEETPSETDNNRATSKKIPLRITLLILASILLMLNNALYILYVPLVIEQYPVISDTKNLYYYGTLYASKDIALLVTSPFVGSLVDRVGYDHPLVTGIPFMLLSSVISAFGDSYWLFFTNRIFQGLNCAFTDISIMVLVSSLFREDNARTNAFGLLLGCASLGFLVASPFAPVIASSFLKERYLFLAFDIAFVVVGLLIFILLKCFRHCQGVSKPVELIPIWRLLIDISVLICAGSLAMSQLLLSFLLYVLPFWFAGYVPAFVNNAHITSFLALFSHILGIVVALLISKKYPDCRWKLVVGGLTLEGFCGLILPFVSSYVAILIPTCGISFGVALVRIIILPTLARLADSRHSSAYGSVVAVSYMSYAIVDIMAPIALYNIIPNTVLTMVFVGIAVSIILYAPITYLLIKAQ